MTEVEQIARDIRDLTPTKLARFREWFAGFDAAEWDRQLDADVDADKLDKLADDALADHRAGRSQKL
jgi:hypothetical protein